jgi:hypothetical protein
MTRSSCHCGAVSVTIASAPSTITDCNCTICRRYGTRWAYFSPKDVTITGATDVYTHGEKRIEFHRCRACGCVTHWAPADKSHDRMGVNCTMMEPAAIAGVRVRRLDGLDTWKYLDE